MRQANRRENAHRVHGNRKREKDFRVAFQEGVHARACMGGSIALVQSDLHTISGKLPTAIAHRTLAR